MNLIRIDTSSFTYSNSSVIRWQRIFVYNRLTFDEINMNKYTNLLINFPYFCYDQVIHEAFHSASMRFNSPVCISYKCAEQTKQRTPHGAGQIQPYRRRAPHRSSHCLVHLHPCWSDEHRLPWKTFESPRWSWTEMETMLEFNLCNFLRSK